MESSKYLLKQGVIIGVFVMTMSDAKKTQYVLAEDKFYIGTKTAVFQSCVNEDELDDLQSTYHGGTWFKKIITRLSPAESPTVGGYSTEATQSPAQPRTSPAATSSSSSSSSSSSQPWDQQTIMSNSIATSSSDIIGNRANSTSDIPQISEVAEGGDNNNKDKESKESDMIVDIGGDEGTGA